MKRSLENIQQIINNDTVLGMILKVGKSFTILIYIYICGLILFQQECIIYKKKMLKLMLLSWNQNGIHRLETRSIQE